MCEPSLNKTDHSEQGRISPTANILSQVTKELSVQVACPLPPVNPSKLGIESDENKSNQASASVQDTSTDHVDDTYYDVFDDNNIPVVKKNLSPGSF